jgi:hypothetical protein
VQGFRSPHAIIGRLGSNGQQRIGYIPPGCTSSGILKPAIIRYLRTNYAQGVSNDTKLDELPWESFGTLLGMTESVTFIPEKTIGRSRVAWIHVIRPVDDCHNLESYSPEALKWWRRFMLQVDNPIHSLLIYKLHNKELL